MELFHKNLLEILVCPSCGSELQLEVLSPTLKDGVFFCGNNHWYPVISGLSRFLVGGLREDYSNFFKSYGKWFASTGLRPAGESHEREESKQVQETFEKKWTSRATMGVSGSSPWKHFMRNWMLKKYGWRSEANFRKQMVSKKLVLDAGTGLGREVINLARAAPKAVVVGLEFSDCAVNALKNVSELNNAYIIQGDILRMPFREESFDFILSEGVLHHTPDPQEAFGNCCRVLKIGGEIAFYVYRKKGPAREFTDDYIRKTMHKMSIEEKWNLANRITKLGKALSELETYIDIPIGIPELGIKKGKTHIHRFIYWNFLKCFWNDELLLGENRLVNFDWFAPEHAYRFTEENIRDWCEKNHIDIVWFNIEESGYSVRGIKKKNSA